MGLGGDRNEREVELLAAPLSFRGFPVAGVRIKGIGEFVEDLVGVWVSTEFAHSGNQHFHPAHLGREQVYTRRMCC